MKSITTLINRFNENFWTAVANSTATNIYSLAVFRIITGAFLLFVLTINYAWMASLPTALFSPPILSPVNLFANGFPHRTWLFIADFILLFTAIAITLGIKPRIASLLFVFTRIIILNYQYSFGKIDHEILLVAMIVCMSFSGWGQKLALWPDKLSRFDSTTKSISLLAVLIGFGYFSAAFEKAIYWLNFDMTITGSARWFYNSLYNYQREPLLAPYLKTAPFWFFKVMDITGVVFELLPFAALLHSRKTWQAWLLLAALFHLINLLFFNINFIVNGIVYLVFIDYTAVYKYIKNVSVSNWFKIVAGCIIVYATIIRILSILTFGKTGIVFLPYDKNMQLYGMLCLWMFICTTLIIGLLNYKKHLMPDETTVLSPQLHKTT